MSEYVSSWNQLIGLTSLNKHSFIIDSLKKTVLFTMPMQHFQKIELTGINVSNKQKILNLK